MGRAKRQVSGSGGSRGAGTATRTASSEPDEGKLSGPVLSNVSSLTLVCLLRNQSARRLKPARGWGRVWVSFKNRHLIVNPHHVERLHLEFNFFSRFNYDVMAHPSWSHHYYRNGSVFEWGLVNNLTETDSFVKTDYARVIAGIIVAKKNPFGFWNCICHASLLDKVPHG